MRALLLVLGCAACTTTSEPLDPTLERVGSQIVVSGGHLESLAVDVRLTGPYEVGGQVKVDEVAFYTVYGGEDAQSWVYTPIAAYATDAHYPADGAITIFADGADLTALRWDCGTANVFVAVGAAVVGDHHIESTEQYWDKVPVECR